MQSLKIIIMIIPVIVFFQSAQAQQTASRVQGLNGWLLPVASNVLSSDENMHLGRGSVNAWDLTAPKGTPIFPMTAGVVTYAGCNNAGGFGCWVELDHGGGYKSRMAHMILGSVQVSSGQQVDQWTVLGLIGWTGKTAFGPHVHFQIHYNDVRQRIDQFFPLSAMHKCDFCEATGQVQIDIRVADSQQVARGSVQAAPMPMGQSIPMVRWLILGMVAFAAACLYLVGGADGIVSEAIGNGGSMALICALLVAPLWLPRMVPEITAGPAAPVAIGSGPPIQGGNAWDAAYAMMRRWEGAKCVNDPARTFRGVTQGTFDSWRRAQGQPGADVCTISELEAKNIYYVNYWRRSGADRLPAPTAITHFDFAVNAGVGAAERALSACSTNVRCYNDYRERFYRSSKSFSLYGAGWLNRLADIRTLTEGKG